ncbi:MAG: HD domain-containing protein [Alcanivoracaceae bacterium]|nr:HD domain-containing protein [Alcanivoracaceae bacterium]
MQQWTKIFSDYIHNLKSADAAHDAAHVQRVAISAVKFSEIEGANLHIVVPAAWLHDCVTVAKNSQERSLASKLSANKAEELLLHWQYPQQYINEIKHAVAAHSYSANIIPETLEAKIVQDADRIDSIGAIGVARMMMVGGKMDCTLYHEQDPFCNARQPSDKQWTVDHFYSKLLKLNSGFHTQAAKDEAQKRHDYMLGFLKQLESEIC